MPAWVILTMKNRGVGYYILAALFPLIGLIFALCLKNLSILAEDEVDVTLPALDITEENEQSNGE